ncbi:unnamed protein product, partial [Laminaria digitata]
MWGRKGTVRESERAQQQQQRGRCSSDTSVRTAAVDAAERACRSSCNSRGGVHVSPVNSRPSYWSSESTTSTTTAAVEADVSLAAELENNNYNSDVAGEAAARLGRAGGGSGGGGGGGGSSRAILWRWSSRRLDLKMAAREPPACSSDGGHRPSARLNPRRHRGVRGAPANATTAAAAASPPPPPPPPAAAAAAMTTKTTVVATTTPQLPRRLGRPRSFPNPSGANNLNPTTAAAARRGSRSTSSAALGLSAAHSSSSSSSLSLSPSPSCPSPSLSPSPSPSPAMCSSYAYLDANPQHVVASMLLNDGGVGCGGGGGACGG